MLSTEGTIQAEPLGGEGKKSAYRRLHLGAPEQRIRRTDLLPGTPPSTLKKALLSLVHLTDMHVVDTQSPGRYEFMERLHGVHSSLRVVLPAFRPQECLQLQACEAMIRTINRIERGPVTDAPLDLLLSTGDNLDNQQQNELAWFMRLMDGGHLDPRSGDSAYEGVQAPDWGDPAYWHPDPVADDFKRDLHFPTVPGLLVDGMRPFEAEGLHLPWLSAYGNHDGLILGAARTNADIEALFVGSRKAMSSPSGFIPDHLSEFIAHPEHFLGAPFREVTPDPARCPCNREEYADAHRTSRGRPAGHGFSHRNLFYVNDEIPAIRLIMLDTTNPGGDYSGSLGAAQARWLVDRLAEVHSRYLAPDGSQVRTDHDDRLVVLCSHNPMQTLTNACAAPAGAPGRDEPRLLRPEVEALVHRFPNVVLWLNGHTHAHRVRPCPDPAGRGGGFWEVTTASLIDWPVQSRLIEIVQNEDDTLSIHCTIINSDVPADPAKAEGPARLAALHRELAANDPHAGIESHLAGTTEDRTVELVLPMPVALES